MPIPGAGNQAVTVPDAKNFYAIRPAPTYGMLFAVDSLLSRYGLELAFADPGYALGEIRRRLWQHGPSYFLGMRALQEDVFGPRDQLLDVHEAVMNRLQSLRPARELVITDPYIFTSSRKRDAGAYAADAAAHIRAALGGADPSILRFVAAYRSSDEEVREALALELGVKGNDLRVTWSEDFHDRFWIADGERGIIVGASLNKIGSKIFFVDTLSDADVAAVVNEVDAL
ncbi:MAG: hypothetical protein HGA44_17655 [Cellulomonadaceae bacterium]|nr:hypothetical protein [Cellulomonadaceae bacterium]